MMKSRLTLATLGRLLLGAFGLILICNVPNVIHAQTPASPLPFVAALTVVPVVAPPGVERSLVVDGIWPNGCIPRGASLRLQDGGSLPQMVITLQRAPDGICTQALTRFSFSLAFTPTMAGNQSVIVQTDDGVRGGEGAIVTTSATPIVSLTPVITVVPDVDIPNRKRAVVITGQHLAGCPFATPVLDGQGSLLLGGVVIRMDPVPTLAPCSTNSPSPYRFEIPYTPIEAGAQRVVVASAGGTIRSESRILTAALEGRTRAVADVTGLWYDPSTSGSGLQFTHNFAGTDVVFGTWYLYDQSGFARWLSIQNVDWQTGGTAFVGDLYETSRVGVGLIICDPVPCTQLLSPLPAVRTTKIGTVRFRFSGLGPYSDTPPTGIAEALSPSGARVFSSNISRIAL